MKTSTSTTRELKRRLATIQSYYDLDDLLSRKTDQRAIAKYYRLSDFFYNLIHSCGGHNIHMSLSDDGKFSRKGFHRQAEIISQHITSGTTKVLELGAGRAANTKYLARKFPNVNFTALDLPNRNFLRSRVPKNVSLVEGDYNDLSRFQPGTFDLVFAVETICHAQSKQNVFAQVSRVLKRGWGGYVCRF